MVTLFIMADAWCRCHGWRWLENPETNGMMWLLLQMNEPSQDDAPVGDMKGEFLRASLTGVAH